VTAIRAILDTIIAQVPGAPFDDTVDVIKTGDPDQPCTGIVTTFMATVDVIRQAIALGANLIITHEPTFYSHKDDTAWLAADPVYLAKRQLIDQHGLVIWRFHDYWHSVEPDGIGVGVLAQLGWQSYVSPDVPYLTMPATPLAELADELRRKLHVPSVRLVGDPGLICEKVALMVGAAGGRWQIGALSALSVDAMICGELNEWETSEYVRDAVQLGRKVGLIVVGHANSEEAGIGYLVDWLKPLLPDVPAHFVPAGDPFLYL
jgi:putative NIF3 family GTP cyclohydrolase 1 type 2